MIEPCAKNTKQLVRPHEMSYISSRVHIIRSNNLKYPSEFDRHKSCAECADSPQPSVQVDE